MGIICFPIIFRFQEMPLFKKRRIHSLPFVYETWRRLSFCNIARKSYYIRNCLCIVFGFMLFFFCCTKRFIRSTSFLMILLIGSLNSLSKAIRKGRNFVSVSSIVSSRFCLGVFRYVSNRESR